MALEPLTVVSSRAVPLLAPNVDTDVIIPVERMMSPDPKSLATWAFESLRYDVNGRPREDCVLNEAVYAGAQILLAGDNFGCGSSREPAVWAVIALGFRCVIASSFGDIFAANCLTNGVLPVVLSVDAVGQLAAAARNLDEITVDLRSQVVTLRSKSWPFEIGHVHKVMLVDGLDEMELGLRHLDAVDRWEAQDRQRRPWAWPHLRNFTEVR
jgi:3-isopropylmalate/(R)-2-methylmalate dehydratase small subunit